MGPGARTLAGQPHRAALGGHWPCAQTAWNGRQRLSRSERATFQARCEDQRHAIIEERELGLAQLEEEYLARSVHRAAVSRALVGLGLLTVQRRTIRPPIQKIRSASTS